MCPVPDPRVFVDLTEHDVVVLEDLLPLDLGRWRLRECRRVKGGDEDAGRQESLHRNPDVTPTRGRVKSPSRFARPIRDERGRRRPETPPVIRTSRNRPEALQCAGADTSFDPDDRRGGCVGHRRAVRAARPGEGDLAADAAAVPLLHGRVPRPRQRRVRQAHDAVGPRAVAGRVRHRGRDLLRRLLPVRGAVEPAAPALRRADVDRPDHAGVGHRGVGDDVRLGRPVVLRAAVRARRGGGRASSRA